MRLSEERVVLFRASTFDSAIRKAEREARKYAADDSGHNGYGQERLLKEPRNEHDLVLHNGHDRDRTTRWSRARKQAQQDE